MTQKDWLKEEIKAYRNYDVAAKSDREIAKLRARLAELEAE